MDEAIIPRATIRARGAAAFNANRSRDSHNMNPGAAALAEWLEGFDEAAKAWQAAQLAARYGVVTRRQAEVVVREVPQL